MAASRPILALSSLGDPSDPGSYSGLPFQLARAIERQGVAVWPVPLQCAPAVETVLARLIAPGLLDLRSVRRHPRHAWRMAVRQARGSEAMTRRRCRRARRHLLHAPRGTVGIVAHGTEVDPGDVGLPLVTYEDSTLAAAIRVSGHYAHLARARRRWLEAAQQRSKRMYGRARGVYFVTDWAARSAIIDYQVPAHAVHAVGQGPNLDPRPMPRDWSRAQFLWAGREWERKGGPAVLGAWPEVRRRHPDAELHLVGAHPAVELAGVVGHGRLALGVAEDRARLVRLFETATCFVMPSAHEPAGTVFVEAARAGVGSIGGAGGGAGFIIGDGGLVVDPSDREAVVDAMVTFGVPEVAEEFGRRARDRSAQLSWDRVAAELLRGLGVPVEGRTVATAGRAS
ncbi:MAG TPA: glycosyltransferase family 4 protein [Mycobacteriales bacterium]|nr:glycosyltransferase family 4 protein [Mycobacteriales bacterium]